MRKFALGLLSVSALLAAPLYQASFDANAKHWEAQRGIATPDNQVQRDGHASLRVEPNGADAYVQSTPVTLTVGKSYELSGWMRTDYDEAGLAYDHPAVRVARFEEAVKVVQGLLRTDGPFNFHGEHYEVLGHTLTPRPVQQPGPPLIIGGGGKRVLSFAAQQADIVSINVNLREGTGGAETAADATPERTRTKVGWVREAAGDRFHDLELNSLIGFVMVTDDAAGLAAQMGPAFGIEAVDALHVPLALVGTLDEMAEELEWRRAEYGISYWSIESDAWETLAPVVAKLAGS